MTMKDIGSLTDRFIGFYSRFDKRLKRIKRERIQVRSMDNGFVQLECTFYGRKYSQVYCTKKL